MAESNCGFGSFKNGRVGFGNIPIKVFASTEIVLDTLTSAATIKSVGINIITTKVKNVSNQVIVIKLLTDRPRNLPLLTDIVLAPNTAADIFLNAYDSEQIRTLRKQLKIIIDPISR